MIIDDIPLLRRVINPVQRRVILSLSVARMVVETINTGVKLMIWLQN